MAHMRDQVASLLLSLLLVQGIHTALGNLRCEDLAVEDCAFAVSSSGARCVLEKYVAKEGGSRLECQTSIIMAEKRYEWIESDECVKSCGLERMSFGLSTDALLENEFTQKLCSSACQQSCSNIVDLYTKLAAGEGVYLPHLCKAQTEKEKSKEEVSLKSISSINEKLVAQPPTSPSSSSSSSEPPTKGTSQGVGGSTPWTAPTPAPWTTAAVPAPAPY